jgi:dTDP-4-dehydrorhamnose 3,5-epimerase
MNIRKTKIAEVLLLEPKVFGDDRGFFVESYNQKSLEEFGLTRNVVEDNRSPGAEYPSWLALPAWAAPGQTGSCGLGRDLARSC